MSLVPMLTLAVEVHMRVCHWVCLLLSDWRMKVKIRQWNGVASWLWVANDENCGICRMPFNGCCPDCKVPGDDCPLVWGQCSHCFHMHCILKWLNSQQVQQQCPMCRQEWKFKEWTRGARERDSLTEEDIFISAVNNYIFVVLHLTLCKGHMEPIVLCWQIKYVIKYKYKPYMTCPVPDAVHATCEWHDFH